MILYNNIRVVTTTCTRCNKEYNKYQQLKFTPILSSPYIKCPNCGKRKYLKFRFD